MSCARRLKKVHAKGPVRQLRHKLGAHLDVEAFGLKDLTPPPERLLEAIGDTLIVLMLTLNHKARAFAWIRHVGSIEEGTKQVVDTMFDYPACTRWVTDNEGNVLDIAAILLAEDPRWAIQGRIEAAINTYNVLAQQTGAKVNSMYMRPTAEVLAEEGLAEPG